VRQAEVRAQVSGRNRAAGRRRRSHPALGEWEDVCGLVSHAGAHRRRHRAGRVEIHYFSEEDLERILALSGWDGALGTAGDPGRAVLLPHLGRHPRSAAGSRCVERCAAWAWVATFLFAGSLPRPWCGGYYAQAMRRLHEYSALAVEVETLRRQNQAVKELESELRDLRALQEQMLHLAGIGPRWDSGGWFHRVPGRVSPSRAIRPRSSSGP